MEQRIGESVLSVVQLQRNQQGVRRQGRGRAAYELRDSPALLPEDAGIHCQCEDGHGGGELSVAPGPDARRVTLIFAAPELDIPPVEVLAEARGGGMFRASGMYASVLGNWQVQVSIDDGDGGPRTATFVLPIQADPVRPPAAPTPVVMTGTWIVGALEVAAIVVGLLLAHRLSMRTVAP